MSQDASNTKTLGNNMNHLALSELLGDIQKPRATDHMQHIPITSIQPNPHQSRKTFDASALDGLASSLKNQGMIHPIVVRTAKEGYELIAGQRRLAAAKKIGLTSVPVIIKQIPDDASMAIALVENIQREALNPIDLALAYQSLMEKTSMTQQSMAEMLGMSRSQVSNTLRLLKLPQPIKQHLSDGKLTMSHARTLLGLDSEQAQITMAETIITHGTSVRHLEEAVNHAADSTPEKRPHQNMPRPNKTETLIDMETKLAQKLQTRVAIQQKASGASKLSIQFSDSHALEYFVSQLLDA